MDDIQFRKNFSSLQLVYSVTEVVGCSIRLDGQLQLGYNLLVYGYLKSHIADRDYVSETTFDLSDSKPRLLFVFLGVFFDKGFNCFNRCDDVWNWEEDTLASHHVTNFELNLLFFL